MLQLGKKGKDKITGFTGVITGRSTWLFGCDQYCLTPVVDEKGDLKEGKWFDEGRIEITGDGFKESEVQVKEPGGPDRGAPMR